MNNSIDKLFLKNFREQLWLDNKPVELVTLSNKNNMTITLMDLGATWLRCQLPIEESPLLLRDVVLYSKDLQSHLNQKAYFGSIVGPYANRIHHSKYSMNKKTFYLEANEAENALHGGAIGLDKLRWSIKEIKSQSVTFTIKNTVPGFADSININVTYELNDDNTVSILYDAISNEDTYLNLTNHAYFNLDGIQSEKRSFDHQFSIQAPFYLPVTEERIPTGEIKSVENSLFDMRPLKNPPNAFDHTFIFDDLAGVEPQVTVLSPDQKIRLEITTSKPSIQFYTGDYLKNELGPFGYYMPNQGFAIEPQYFPDGPNRPQWVGKNGFLYANTPYKHRTNYQFHISK